MITEIIQESTDSIYQFEDDSITLAEHLLKEVLRKEVTLLAAESMIETNVAYKQETSEKKRSFKKQLAKMASQDDSA